MACRLLGVLCSLLTVSLSPVLGDGCILHPYLTDLDQWETQVSFVGKMTALFVRFRGQYMNETAYGPLGEDEIQRECVASYADNKYVYKWSNHLTTLYRCYQLIPVSRNVVVLRQSGAVSDLQTAQDLCTSADDRLEYNDWPLISTKSSPHPDTNRCGLDGGFDFYVRLNGMQYCQDPDKSMVPRLEVGCPDSGSQRMHLDFRNNFNCRGFLEMTLQQELTCLGSWDRGPYRFTVITDDAELWPKIWLLRFPRDVSLGPSFEMYVLPDVEMDMTPVPESTGVSYIHTLVVSRTDFGAVCQDEATPKTCDSLCSGDYDMTEFDLDKIHCQKSCGLCPVESGQCVLPSETKGEWLQFTETGIRRVALTSSLIYVDGLPPMRCLNLSAAISGRQALVSFYKNGCKPQYRCVQLEVRGPNVILFGLTEAHQWPYKNSLTSADLCLDEFFSLSDPGGLPEPGILLRVIGKRPVDCQIRGSFVFSARRNGEPNKSTWSGAISSCSFRDVFTIQYDREAGQSSHTYQCLASFEDGSFRILITEGEDDVGDGSQQCWLIHRYEEDEHTTVYQMPLSSCYVPPGSINQGDNIPDYVMMYNVSAGLELWDESSCSADRLGSSTSTSRSPALVDTTSTSAVTTSWRFDLITQHIPPQTPTTEKPYSITNLLARASSAAWHTEASVYSLLAFLASAFCV